MYVKTTSAKGTDIIPVSAQLLADRDVYLVGDIDDEKVMAISQQILYLVRQDDKAMIRLWINSPGGSVVSGLVLHDIIRSIKTPIMTIASGPAYSMGAFLVATGQKGKRVMFPNAELMLHEPMIARGVGGSCTYVKCISESLFEAKQRINEILAQSTGRTLEEINQVTAQDTYFNAERAIEFGLVDKVVTMEEVLRSE